jgi:ATP-dependent DNA ligase
MDERRTDQPIFFAFDPLFLKGESTAQRPLTDRTRAVTMQRLSLSDDTMLPTRITCLENAE